MKKLILPAIFILVFLSACGRQTPVEAPEYITEPDQIVEEPLLITEDEPPAEPEPPPYPTYEPEYIPDEIAYFPRIDHAAIDFSSLIFPCNTPHGYIGHRYVRHISRYLPSRVAFTYRELDTALWLVEMLHAKGFCESLVYMQTFSLDCVTEWEGYFFRELPGPHDVRQLGWTDGHKLRDYSQNIIVTIPGQSMQTIIIGAHYDSLRYPGTSDNASGTALLMENAQRMLNQDNYYTLVYVFFGGHEVGMLGGFYFYNSLSQEQRENTLIFIQADVLIEGPQLVFSTGYTWDLNQNALSEQMATVIESFSEAHEISIHQAPVMGSEKWLFLYKGHTTLAFWGVDPVRFTNFLHSERDCYEYISAMFPGMIERTMNAYALILEAVLLENNFNW